MFSARLHSCTDWLGCSIHVRAVLTDLVGAVVSPRFLLAVVTNCVLGHWVFGVSCFSVVVCGYAGSTVDYPLWSAICVNVHCVFGLLKYPVWVAAGLFWPR